MSELNDQIDRAVGAALRTNDLKQAHARLADARTLVKTALMLIEQRSADGAHRRALIDLIENGLEPIMWGIETEVRERQARPR